MQSRKLLVLLPFLLILASCSRDPRAQAQRYLENGNKFFAKARYKEASIMYRRALQKNLRFGEAYYRLALTDLKLGAYGDAARMLRRAIELQPSNTEAITKLADLFLLAATQDQAHAKELLKEVKELTDKLLQQNPNSFEGHRLQGQMAMMNRDMATAVAEFNKANAVKPYQIDLALAYFQALANNKQLPEAEKFAREMISREKTFAPMYDILYVQYIKENKVNEAEQVLKLKVDNNPKQGSFLLQLAGHYYILNRRPDMDAVMQRLTNTKEYPEGHLLAGDFFFFRARELDRAKREYEEGAKAFPKDKALYQKRLVELYASSGKSTDASQLLAAILKDHPKDNDAIAMRAALMLNTGNRDQINMAANDLQALVAKMPQNHLLHFNLARALAAKGEVDQARLQLEEAVQLRPDFLAARELLARIYIAKNDWAKAREEADQIITFDARNLQGHLIRSSALLGMGDKDKARQELDLIAKSYPQNPEARYQMGFLAWQEKDYKRAEQIFGDLYKANPNDFRGLVGVVETMASQNRIGDAIKVMQTAIEHDPQRQDFKLALANLYVRSARYDDAIQMLQALIDKNPKSADLLYRLGETERLKGDLDRAAETFRRATQAAPNAVEPMLRLALLMEFMNKSDQAKPMYEQILKIQPNHPVALNNLAYINAEAGTDLDQALTMAQRARQQMPNAPEVGDTLGLIYIKKSLSEDAVRVFRDLVQKDPNNALFRYHLGMALLQKGDRPTAKKELELAMKSKPSKDQADKIRDLLQKI